MVITNKQSSRDDTSAVDGRGATGSGATKGMLRAGGTGKRERKAGDDWLARLLFSGLMMAMASVTCGAALKHFVVPFSSSASLLVHDLLLTAAGHPWAAAGAVSSLAIGVVVFLDARRLEALSGRRQRKRALRGVEKGRGRKQRAVFPGKGEIAKSRRTRRRKLAVTGAALLAVMVVQVYIGLSGAGIGTPVAATGFKITVGQEFGDQEQAQLGRRGACGRQHVFLQGPWASLKGFFLIDEKTGLPHTIENDVTVDLRGGHPAHFTQLHVGEVLVGGGT